MGKFLTRKVSVRRSRDFVKVQIFSDGAIIFKGSAPVGDVDKIRGLLSTMRAKGVCFPRDNNWW